jgi:hypothetical protein
VLLKTVTIAGGDWSDAYGDGDERHGGPGDELHFRSSGEQGERVKQSVMMPTRT